MSINRLKQLEKRLSRKLSTVDEKSKWRFPIICSNSTPGLYYLTKWQDGKFVQVEATKEEVNEYNRGVTGGATFLPEEDEGVIIFKPERN